MMTIEVENKLLEIKDLIKDKFPDQLCYFRGEPKFYETISASLRRDRKMVLPCYEGENPGMHVRILDGIKFDVPQRVSLLFPYNDFVYCRVRNLIFEVDIRNPETLYEMSMVAGHFIEGQTKNFLGKETNLGILQHLGYPTPYIDFTKDYLVSLFFACNKLPNEDGRIIMLGNNDSYKFHDMTQAKFLVAKERAIAQKSVMLEKLELKKTEDNYAEYRIPYDLKPKILTYLEEEKINCSSLFPDSWDYEKEYEPYKEFYQGVREEVNGNHSKAITRYTAAIDLNSDFIHAYKRRARILYHKLGLEQAQRDIKKVFSLEQKCGFYDADKEDEIIGLHLFFDEHNPGCMHRILAGIYKHYGDKISSQEYMRRAEYIQHRYKRREENEDRKKH